MNIGNHAITPQGTIVKILAIEDESYEPPEPDVGYRGGVFYLYACSDGELYDNYELTPIEEWNEA